MAILVVTFVLSGCGTKEVYMDQPADDGKYHYKNESLEFNLTLPEEFIYYQTQRKQEADNTIIEFFVPTNDLEYYQEVSSYAKAIVVRVFEKSDWDLIEKDVLRKEYNNIKEVDDKVYTLKFWDKTPADWQNKWSLKLEDEIINGFKVE